MLPYYLTNTLGSLKSSCWNQKTSFWTYLSSSSLRQNLLKINLGILQIDGSKNFKSSTLHSFYNKTRMNIGYKKNGIVKQCWRNLLSIKDSHLINNDLFINYWPKAIDTTNYLQIPLPVILAIKSVIIPTKA